MNISFKNEAHQKVFLSAGIILLLCSLVVALSALILSEKISVLTIIGLATIALAFGSILVANYIGNKSLEDKKVTIEKLQAAEQKAVESFKAKTMLMAIAGHELRTPLNGIFGLAGLLQKSNLPKKETELVDSIYHSCKSLIKIISNILEFARIEAGQIKLENAEFSLNVVIHQVITTLSIQARDKNISLTHDIDKDVPQKIFGDASILSQILYTLVGNAIKFTAVGSVVLKVKVDMLDPGTLLRLQFSIEDTGIGMSKEQVQKLFLPFAAIQASGSSRGLGLAITQQLAKAMGGEIQVNSVPGQGTSCSFIANFYKFSEERFGSEEERQLQGADEHKEIVPIFLPENMPTIMVVDDNPTNLLVAQAMLERLGAKTIVANNGKEALYEYSNAKVDLILMDSQMPVMDGFETTRELRKNNARIPILAMTAYTSYEDQQKCFAYGMDGIIAKPVEISILTKELKKLLVPEANSVSEESLKNLESTIGPAGMANALRRRWFIPSEHSPEEKNDRFV